MEDQNQDTHVQSSDLQSGISSSKAKSKQWLSTFMVVISVFIAVTLIFLALYGPRLVEHFKGLLSDTNLEDRTKPKVAQNGWITFPEANYQDFATTDNTDSLDPSIATPALNEVGTPHLTVTKNDDAYATVTVNPYVITINIPLGWESNGGFDTFDKIFFYPAGSLPNDGGLPSPFIALKVLDSRGIGVSDFDSVMSKIEEFMKDAEATDPAYQNRVVYIDVANKTFAYEVKGPKHEETGRPLGILDIYIQDPNPDSTLWVDLQLSVSLEEYERYKGLDGLIYKDLDINWNELAKLAAQVK